MAATINNVVPYSHEQDPRWTACDAYQFPLLNPSHRPEVQATNQAFKKSAAHGLEDISVAPSQGKFLSLQCQILDAKNVLEVGTLGGYSAIWMGSSSPDVRIVSIEIDKTVAEIARENIRMAGMEGRIEVVVGAALDVLRQLATEVEAGRRPKFDFCFIDADKANALSYFRAAVGMTRKKGLVYVDNIVRRGLLADSRLAETDENVRGIRECVEGVGGDERVAACVLQTVGEKNYDGFLLAVIN